MIEVDRMALIFQPKEAFMNWLKDIHKEEFSKEESTSEMTMVTEPTVILIPVIEDNDMFNEYIKTHYSSWLAYEFASWCENEDEWPEERDLAAFQEYFDVHVHSIVIDNVSDEYIMQANTTLQ
jgi:hypothetical protein